MNPIETLQHKITEAKNKESKLEESYNLQRKAFRKVVKEAKEAIKRSSILPQSSQVLVPCCLIQLANIN